MPVLTKAQVIEAIFDLPAREQAEVIEEIRERIYPLNLTEERKNIIRAEIAAHDADPSSSISWDDLKAELQSQLRS